MLYNYTAHNTSVLTVTIEVNHNKKYPVMHTIGPHFLLILSLIKMRHGLALVLRIKVEIRF